MNIVFENEDEQERILQTLNLAIAQIDMNLEDHIENINIKNILMLFSIKCEHGAVQLMRNITPRGKQITGPGERRSKK